MELLISRYRISSDVHGYVLEKQSKTKAGEVTYINPGYFSSLQNTAVALLGRLIKDGRKEESEEVLTAKELITVIKDAKAEILAALGTVAAA